MSYNNNAQLLNVSVISIDIFKHSFILLGNESMQNWLKKKSFYNIHFLHTFLNFAPLRENWAAQNHEFLGPYIITFLLL